MGPVNWSYFYLYVILDIDRHRVVGWRVERAESASQFKALLIDAMGKHAVPRDQLTLHADRGAAPVVICRQITAGQRMKAKTAALMLADLGMLKSHSRPHTSNDNPFSEAHFKTLKYQPEFPRRFQTIDESRTFCRRFFAWYNEDNHHAGISLMTPNQIHFGQADAIYAARQTTLDVAFPAHLSASRTSRQNHHRFRQPSGSTRRKTQSNPSLKSNCRRLKVVDTFRPSPRSSYDPPT
jgi:putative transposase